jgi:HlyD family secretion protein
MLSAHHIASSARKKDGACLQILLLTSKSPCKGGETRPHYKARIQLTSKELRNVPSSFRLIPGMSVTVEIKAGERTILSYFMYPLLRGLDESIREP